MATRALALRPSFRFDPGVLALLAAVAIWGVTMVITRSALESTGPFTILAARFIIGFALLVPFARRRGFRMKMVVRPVFIAFGAIGIVAHNGLETIGLQFTSAGSGALVIAAVPAVTAAMSIVMLKEKVGKMQAFGIAISIGGVALVSGSSSGVAGSAEPFGNFLVFLGVVAWGLYTVQGKRLVTDLPSLVITTAGMGAAVGMLVPMAVTEVALTGVPQVAPVAALGIVYLGVMASGIAYALWNYALNHVDAAAAGPFANLVPVIGLVAAVMAGESTSPIQLLGGAVVAIGLSLSESARIRRARDMRDMPSPA
jgi:drug/metabolite transporter (DMT)-like permease